MIKNKNEQMAQRSFKLTYSINFKSSYSLTDCCLHGDCCKMSPDIVCRMFQYPLKIYKCN